MGKDLKGKELGKGFVQRKDGNYYFRFTSKTGRRIGDYDASLSNLKKRAKKIMAEDELGVVVNDSKYTLNYMFDLSMKVYRLRELKESTISNYQQNYNRYVRNGLGKHRIVLIKPREIMNFFNKISKKYSLSVCRTLKACLVSAYDAAILEEVVTFNYVKSIKISSDIEQKKVKALTIEEQKLFLKYAKTSYFYNLYVLIFNTGLRLGEARGLSVNDIDLDNNIIHVRRALYYKNEKGTFSNGSKYRFDKPKRDSERDIPINKTLRKALENQLQILKLLKLNMLQKNNKKYRKINEFDDLLFLSRTGTPISGSMINTDLHDIVNEINKNEKIDYAKFGIHTLRHTFGTNCYNQQLDTKKLQTFMGHKSIKTTMDVYVTENIGQDTLILDNLFS